MSGAAPVKEGEFIVVRQANGYEVDKRVAQVLPEFLVLADGSYALNERDAGLVEEAPVWDAGEVLYAPSSLEVLPQRPEVGAAGEDLDTEEFAQAMTAALREEERPDLPAGVSAAALSTRFDTAFDWMRPLLGEMPYWLWRSGSIPDAAGAYAVNRPVPSVDSLAWQQIFCAGVGNLLLRRVLKRIPTYGSALFDGGLVAYWSYFRHYIRPFEASRVHRGGMAIRRFRNASDQGHVAWALGGYDDPVLQSFWGWGDRKPGLNTLFTMRQSHAGGYYEGWVDAVDFINYRGDEFA